MNALGTGWMDAAQLAPMIEIGDLIEFRRVLGGRDTQIYTHWAVVVDRGETRVAHISAGDGDFDVDLDSPAPSFDSFKDLGKKLVRGSTAEVPLPRLAPIRIEVRCDDLATVARGGRCRINNFLDNRLRPFPPVIVVDRALTKLGVKGYNILFNNCEHFVKWCRYGARQSDQVLPRFNTHNTRIEAIVAKTVLVGASIFAVSGGSVLAGAGSLLASYTVMRLGRVIRSRFFPRYPAALL